MLPAGSPLSAWLTWLETLHPDEIELGLERVRAVLERLDVERPGHVLIVAGTNGKGSSVAMASALLNAAGLRVGAYTSPHIVDYNERIAILDDEGRRLASDAEIIAAFEKIESVRDDVPLTYFEYGTLAAVVAFSDAKLDAWILEVGMGGRLDATNAIEPTAALITNVALDHCEWLGDDIETIAVEKAGVMRPGMPVVYGGADVPQAIIDHADAIGAHLLLRGRAGFAGCRRIAAGHRSGARGVGLAERAAGWPRAARQRKRRRVAARCCAQPGCGGRAGGHAGRRRPPGPHGRRGCDAG